jgi:hypothetical protein
MAGEKRALTERARGLWSRSRLLVSGRLASRWRQRAAESCSSGRRRGERLLEWAFDLGWVRYSRFYRQDRRNERAVLLLEKELPERISASFKEQEDTHELTIEKYKVFCREFLERQELFEENRKKPEGERAVLPWSDLDRFSLNEIDFLRRTELEGNSSHYEDRRHMINSNVASKQLDAARYRTEFLKKEARLYEVPLPKEDKDGMWHEVPSDLLTTQGYSTLRTLVRKERRDRWEYVQIRIALALSILTFGISIVNLVNKVQSPPQVASSAGPR